MGLLDRLKEKTEPVQYTNGLYVVKTRYLKDDVLRKCREFQKSSPLYRDIQFSLQVCHGVYIVSVKRINQLFFAHLLDYLQVLGEVKGIFEDDVHHYLYMIPYHQKNTVEMIHDNGETYLLNLPLAYQSFDKGISQTTNHDVMSWAHRISLECGYDVVSACEKELYQNN